MKKYHLIITTIFLLSVQLVHAQITLNLALNSRPQPWLSEWANPVNGQMIISYMPGADLDISIVKIRTTLFDQSENILGISNISTSRPYTLRMGVNLFSMADALQLQNLALSRNIQNLLQRTGRLTAGQYQLKVEVLNNSGSIVLAQQTRQFFITSYHLPVLMYPSDEEQLDAQIAQSIITFRWTSLTPIPSELPIYRVQVFEILPDQTPMQAFRGNRPILDEIAIRGTTQFIWHPNLAMMDSTANYKFIWTVQSLDSEGQPYPSMDMNIQGRSEPAIFTIINQMGGTNLKNKNED